MADFLRRAFLAFYAFGALIIFRTAYAAETLPICAMSS